MSAVTVPAMSPSERTGPVAASPGATVVTPPTPEGRSFRRSRPVRLGDSSPRGRLRLDAVARYLQDIANDDVADAGLSGGATAWVVRRTLVEAPVPITYGERVEITTWCSATGARWAERRTTLAGSEGGFVEAVSLWVHVDLVSGVPARLDRRFDAVYGPSAGGRRVQARRLHGGPPADAGRCPLISRFADFDVMGHVNNAVHWAVVEDHLAGRGWSGRVRASIEYRSAIGPGDEVEVASAGSDDRLALWWLVGEGVVATAAVEALAEV